MARWPQRLSNRPNVITRFAASPPACPVSNGSVAFHDRRCSSTHLCYDIVGQVGVMNEYLPTSFRFITDRGWWLWVPTVARFQRHISFGETIGDTKLPTTTNLEWAGGRSPAYVQYVVAVGGGHPSDSTRSSVGHRPFGRGWNSSMEFIRLRWLFQACCRVTIAFAVESLRSK